MKSFYSIFVLGLVIFLCQLSNQFQTDQIELPDWKQSNESLSSVAPAAVPENSDLIDAASSEANELSKWLDLKRFVLKQSNWVKLKDLKVKFENCSLSPDVTQQIQPIRSLQPGHLVHSGRVYCRSKAPITAELSKR